MTKENTNLNYRYNSVIMFILIPFDAVPNFLCARSDRVRVLELRKSTSALTNSHVPGNEFVMRMAVSNRLSVISLVATFQNNQN
jgi:hypothetical protein